MEPTPIRRGGADRKRPGTLVAHDQHAPQRQSLLSIHRCGADERVGDDRVAPPAATAHDPSDAKPASGPRRLTFRSDRNETAGYSGLISWKLFTAFTISSSVSYPMR